MKKILYACFALSVVLSCTKHDPFDNLDGGDQLWILSKFAERNVNSLTQSAVSFYETDSYLPVDEGFFTYSDLKTNNQLNKVFTDADGGYWRIPTAGELKMAFPQLIRDDYTASLNMTSILIFSWAPTAEKKFTTTETAFLDNDSDYKTEISGEIISGESVFFYDEDYEDNNPDVFPIYALRFKGTSQYAAYRYEVKIIEDEPGTVQRIESYINLKAKWLKAGDTTTTIEDISKDDYWASGYLELNFPIEGVPDATGVTQGYEGKLLSSTLGKNIYDEWSPFVAWFTQGYADLRPDYYGESTIGSLRLLKCKEDGSL